MLGLSTFSSFSPKLFTSSTHRFELEEHFKDIVRALFANYYFAQLFPFLVLFGLPALTLLGYTYGPSSARRISEGTCVMLTGALSYLFPGLGNVNGAVEGSSGSSGADGRRERRRRAKGKEISNGNAIHGGEHLDPSWGEES